MHAWSPQPEALAGAHVMANNAFVLERKNESYGDRRGSLPADCVRKALDFRACGNLR